MGLRRHVSPDESTITIKIEGVFDLSVQSDFRVAYEQGAKAQKYIIDMSDTEYMDSAAFGMLLVFRDYVGGDDADISITHVNENIRKSFSMLQFDRMFRLD